MADEKVGKYTDTGLVDVQAFKDKLVDIKGGDLQGYRRSKPGLAGALGELERVMPTHGDEARIHASTYQEILEVVGILASIGGAKPSADKLAEVLKESEVYYEDKLEMLLSRLGKTVVDTAKDAEKPGLLAVYELTLKYRGQYAEKAAATRRKNEKGDADGTDQPAPEGEPGPG